MSTLKVIEADGTLSPAPRNLPTELFLDFERDDDSAIMAELQGAVVAEYVYSFAQAGKTITGLSLPGVMAVAQRMGGITCGQPIWTVAEDGVTCDISATDHKVGLTVWGTATALYDEYGNGKRDKFARAKALSKAQRNAIRKVIPETVATQMLKTFLDEKRGGNQPRQQAQTRQPAQRSQPRRSLPPGTPTVDSDAGRGYEDIDLAMAEELTERANQATVVDGRVVTDDGEIVARLEQQDDKPEPAEAYRIIMERLEAATLRDMGGIKLDLQAWGMANDDALVAAYNDRYRALKDEAKAARKVSEPQTELVTA